MNPKAQVTAWIVMAVLIVIAFTTAAYFYGKSTVSTAPTVTPTPATATPSAFVSTAQSSPTSSPQTSVTPTLAPTAALPSPTSPATPTSTPKLFKVNPDIIQKIPLINSPTPTLALKLIDPIKIQDLLP